MLAHILLLASAWTPGAAPSARQEDFRPVDRFEYSTQRAREIWHPMAGSEPVSVAREDGRRFLRMPCRFAGRKIDRASWDRTGPVDLAACRGLQLLFRCRDTTPVRSFSVYFHSGGGWYHGTFAAGGGGDWQQVRIPKAATRIEGSPAGWGRVDAIRFSAWRGGDADTEVHLAEMGLYGTGGQVVVVLGDSAADSAPDEAEGIRRYAAIATDLLDELGLDALPLSDRDLTSERLAGRKVVILPYNPTLPAPAVAALRRFVASGGRLLACYCLPRQLAGDVGIRPAGHVRQKHPGQFAYIRPGEKPLPGAPQQVAQASWNIRPAEPVGPGARVAAWWHDAKGKPTGQPAVVVSEKAVFLTHVLLGDDRPAKRRLLLAMLGSLAPPLWRQAAEGAIARAGRFEPYGDFAAAAAGIRSQAAGRKAALDELARAERLLAAAGDLAAGGRCVEAVEKASQAHDAALRAHCLAQKPLPGEHRAFWCHSAFGVAGMTWEQAVRLLADNGFTAILPNMLWGGVAFYDSDVLPVAPEVRTRGDQLALCLAACRKYGVQCHVWKVNWNMGWHTPREFMDRMAAAGRTQVRPDGSANTRWLCPSHPENRRLEIDAMVEVARKYPVDGVHFDYVRYPGREGCYCPGCRRRFEQAVGRKVPRWPGDLRDDKALAAAWMDFRREQINAVVRGVAERLRKDRPGVKISAAVFRNWPTDRDEVGQDWKLWCDRGWVDFVCPMDYTPHSGQFEAMVARQQRWAGKTPCYPGIGLSVWPDPTDIAKFIAQVRATRRLGTGGFTVFNYDPAAARDVLPRAGLGLTRPVKRPAPPRAQAGGG